MDFRISVLIENIPFWVKMDQFTVPTRLHQNQIENDTFPKTVHLLDKLSQFGLPYHLSQNIESDPVFELLPVCKGSQLLDSPNPRSFRASSKSFRSSSRMCTSRTSSFQSTCAGG